MTLYEKLNALEGRANAHASVRGCKILSRTLRVPCTY